MRRLRTSEKHDNLFYTKLTINEVNYWEMQKAIKKRKQLLTEIKENNRTIQMNTEEDINTFFFMLLLHSKRKDNINEWISLEMDFFRYKIEQIPKIELERYFYNKFLHHLKYKNGTDRSTKTGNILKEMNFRIPETNKIQKVEKVHFTKVIDLISKHQIVPENGFVDFEDSLISSILINGFREYLIFLVEFMHERNKENNDDRIDELYTILNEEKYTNTKNIKSTKLLNVLKYLPPCIWEMLENLKSKGHLYNFERLIINRYFHSMGVDIEELIKFLKGMYKVPEETFNKEYLYNIRHVYGLEGKKSNYSSFSCSKIINSNQQCSGCPFYTNTIDKYLKANEVVLEDIHSNENPKINCGKLCIKISGNEESNVPINSPNDFTRNLLELNW